MSRGLIAEAIIAYQTSKSREDDKLSNVKTTLKANHYPSKFVEVKIRKREDRHQQTLDPLEQTQEQLHITTTQNQPGPTEAKKDYALVIQYLEGVSKRLDAYDLNST